MAADRTPSAASSPRQSAANFRAAANELLHQFAKATGVYLWLDYIGFVAPNRGSELIADVSVRVVEKVAELKK